MALFVLICVDHPNALERRMSVRAEHLAYVQANIAMVRLAGPLLSDAGEMAGSMFIIEAPDRATVTALNAGDPYTLANVFERVEIRPWKVTVGAIA
jgi:uncharacterized protein YciI